jgi:myosin X
MASLGMVQRIREIWAALAGVLHLGNIMFRREERNNVESSSITNPEGKLNIKNAIGLKILLIVRMHIATKVVAELLGVPEKKLAQTLLTRSSITRNEKIVTPLTQVKAADARDALAKGIYGRFFLWVIDFINTRTRIQANGNATVGILDIFGFENFEVDH